MRSKHSVSATSSTTMISVGFWARQVARQAIRMFGSSWNEGTTTDVVVVKPFSTGDAIRESTTR
jgi:hypothetical protein